MTSAIHSDTGQAIIDQFGLQDQAQTADDIATTIAPVVNEVKNISGISNVPANTQGVGQSIRVFVTSKPTESVVIALGIVIILYFLLRKK